MTLEEVVRLANNDDLDACKVVLNHYIERNMYLEALPYAEKLANAGDATVFGLLSTLYTIKGQSFLDIGVPTEECLEEFNKSLTWAEKAKNNNGIIASQRSIGECYYLMAHYAEKSDKVKSDELYLKSYNFLIKTVGKGNAVEYDLVWALTADKLSKRGYNIPENAQRLKISILVKSYNERDGLKQNSPRSITYLKIGILNLGNALLEGKEIERNDNFAYAVFKTLLTEFGMTSASTIVNLFRRNANGTYTFMG